jgi:hypothetical protein
MNTISLHLSTIHIPPDWTRYPLPGDLWLLLLKEELTIVEAVRQWVETADGGDSNLADIKRLASSISEVGLTEPIQVTEDRTLVSGLRRLLAHVYLVTQGKERFDTIEAVVVEGARPLRAQLAETLVREDLTAVETAISVARLIAAIEEEPIEARPPYVRPDGTIAVPIELRKLLIRRRGYGTWTRITEMLGKSDRRWRQYANILTLCDSALTLAHRAGLTEWALREVVQADLDCEAQIERVRWMIAGRPREDEDEDEEEEAEPASPAVVASVRNIVSACDHLATFNPDSLHPAVARVFGGLEPEELENAYGAFEVIYNTLRDMRNWHKGKDREICE